MPAAGGIGVATVVGGTARAVALGPVLLGALTSILEIHGPSLWSHGACGSCCCCCYPYDRYPPVAGTAASTVAVTVVGAVPHTVQDIAALAAAAGASL